MFNHLALHAELGLFPLLNISSKALTQRGNNPSSACKAK
jgi:hypothetical protein